MPISEGELSAWRKTYEDSGECVVPLVDEVFRLRKVLEFYADEKNWIEARYGGEQVGTSTACADRGYKAKEAL